MENESNNSTITMKKFNRSISDADSLTNQVESFYSPLHDLPFRSDSPLHSDSPLPHPDSKAIVAVDKYYSPLRSLPPTNNKHNNNNNNNVHCPPPVTPPATVSQSSKVIYNRSVKEDLVLGVTKVGPAGGEEEGSVGGGRKSRASILSRSRKDVTVERAALGLRVSEVIFSLISFSVMAADKTEGWSGDSFDRYKEYRYCLSVAVISFVYSGFQAYDLAYHLVTGKHVIPQHLRCHFDFLMDQILAYLLLSASSSAATRVDDWVSNWGKDQFTEMASASVGMAFLAFVAFALSSLPWEVGQVQNSLNFVPQFQDNGLANNQLNGDSSLPWWQQKNVRINEIEFGNEYKAGSSAFPTTDRPVQRSWAPPLQPPVAMAEAAAAIRQPKKSTYQSEALTDDQFLARSSELTDELQRITKTSESGSATEANGGKFPLNTEIRTGDDNSYVEA